MPTLVHDYLLVMRGAERTFLAMCDLYPGAPVATLLYDQTVFQEQLEGRRVRASAVQKLGVRQGTFKALMPALPTAVEYLRVDDEADFVLSSSSAFAHGVRPAPGVLHVCYCHTPFRYSWYARQQGLAQVPSPLRPLLGRTLDRIRDWDRRVAQRPTVYVANSLLTQDRIRQYWGRETAVVHPPVEVERFSPGEPEDFFLVVGELVLHKNVEVALKAARNARVPIKVVGTGADERRLKALYGGHADFLGRVDDETLADLYSRTRALVLPAIEEFGITAVEAQAAGRPVIAADGGGALETVVAGETGLFVPVRDADALAKALLDPALDGFDPTRAVENAQRFSVANFQRALAFQIEAARSLTGQS